MGRRGRNKNGTRGEEAGKGRRQDGKENRKRVKEGVGRMSACWLAVCLAT